MLFRHMPFKLPRRLQRHRTRILAAFVLGGAATAAAHVIFEFQPDGITTAAVLFLSLVLFEALGAGRELLTPSLRELAFYFIAILAAGLIWPGAHLAMSTYEAAGFVTLALFMVFAFVVAVALAVLAVELPASQDGEN